MTTAESKIWRERHDACEPVGKASDVTMAGAENSAMLTMFQAMMMKASGENAEPDGRVCTGEGRVASVHVSNVTV